MRLIARREWSGFTWTKVDRGVSWFAGYAFFAQLMLDPSVDAVYNPLPNGLHGKWTLAALEAGKHVLCEKPFTANASEAASVASAARDRTQFRAGVLAGVLVVDVAVVGGGSHGDLLRLGWSGRWRGRAYAAVRPTAARRKPDRIVFSASWGV